MCNNADGPVAILTLSEGVKVVRRTFSSDFLRFSPPFEGSVLSEVAAAWTVVVLHPVAAASPAGSSEHAVSCSCCVHVFLR